MKRLIYTIMVIIFAAALPAGAVALNVPADYPTIQSAIDAAVDGDIVIVAPGTYTGDGNWDIDFKGKAITVRSTDPNDPNIVAETIIDCNGSYLNKHQGFCFQNGEDANSVVDGLTITNGYISQRPSRGGIFCRQSSPTITNCNVVNNTIGIVYVNGNPKIINCTVNGNYESGIYFLGADTALIKNCTINGNCTIIKDDQSGIQCRETDTVLITNCTIIGNNSGGINCGDDVGALIVKNCIINANKDRYGAAICYSNHKNAINNCFIENCFIKNNVSQYCGGAIYLYTPSRKGFWLIMNGCTIIENQASQGGGIFVYHIHSKITNSILWENKASNGGPQIFLSNKSHIEANYSNTQNGQAGVYVGPDCTLNWGSGNIDIEPMFVDAGYWDPNGTPNDANDDFWVEGDYHLLPESPCIDAGDPNYVPEPNGTDLDGNPRVFGGRIDMGAYEFNPIEAQMQITPNTLNCKSKGNWLKAHITLPEEILPEEIDVNTPAVLEPFDIESEYIEIIGSDAGPVQLEIGFDRQSFCEAADEEGLWEIEVWGRLKNGRYFVGTDTIRINKRGQDG
jgi:parallel beta-helix repeat protein